MNKSNKVYKFTEMFRADQDFVFDYRMEECGVITYPTSFPLDALIEPYPTVLTTTLYEYAYKVRHADVIRAESSLVFYESGMVKHVYKEWRDAELIKDMGGWYDRMSSEKIDFAFNNINFQGWEKDYSEGMRVYDGGGWALNISFINGEQINSKGLLDYPESWKEARLLFGLRF